MIITEAGNKGAVTVATNMAGRGVDIILGGSRKEKWEVDFPLALGGLVAGAILLRIGLVLVLPRVAVK